MKQAFKIAVFYYTQTGQALAIAQKMCEPLAKAGCSVVYKEIVPERPYPFPWSANDFFQVFPESRLGIACPLKPFDLNDVHDADLVMIAGQSWYLSLSVPLHAFFQSDEVKAFLKGRRVVFVNGCRNMWMMTQQKVREYIREAGGDYVGWIVLQDRSSNLIGVLSTVRWLIRGQKEATRWLPSAGVSQAEIDGSTRFGDVLLTTLRDGAFDRLQERLMEKEAITFIPHLYFIERNGYRIWGKWAHFVRKRGGYLSPARKLRLDLFRVYLFFVLYVVSPFGLLFHYITYPFRKKAFVEAKRKMCYERA